MALPAWAFEYPAEEERKNPERYSGDYFRDTLPLDLYEFEGAVVDGDVFTVRKCLECGVNLNAALDSNHMTALMIACSMGNWDIIQMLVEDFDADLDGPLSIAGMRAIDYAAFESFRFPLEHPIVEYLKSKGSNHTWWGACIAGDYHRLAEYIENGQDVDEINPVLWNCNGIFLAQEFGQNKCASYLLTKGGTVTTRNCHNIDTLEDKWSIGRGDTFFYKSCKLDRPGAGDVDFYVPEWE
jgi:ankyrin repeat protein